MTGMYTVNIALLERRDNSRWSPILGVVHAPEFGWWFRGGNGRNAAGCGGIGAIIGNNNAPLIVGSVSHASLGTAFAEAVGEHVFEVGSL